MKIVSLIFLRLWPFALALLSFAILMKWEESVLKLISDEKLALSGLYASVFDWSAIQTGFLFSVFGFIVGKRDGFVKAIEKTIAMKRFRANLMVAVIAGFSLTVISMPMIAYPITPTGEGLSYTFICGWFSLFVWAFCLFCKVAFEFGLIVRVPDKEDRPAG